MFSKKYQLKSTVVMCIVLIFCSSAAADTNATVESGASSFWKWTLEIESKYTCTGVNVYYKHTDTHKGSVSFAMPEVAGKVEGKGGQYSYHSTGHTMGRPWQFSGPGTLTFTGEVTPGILRLTPQVYLPDGRPFYSPTETFEMPIYNGATYTKEPDSDEEVKCVGQAIWTLHGAPREHYRIMVDDRFLLVKEHGEFSRHIYRTGITLQVITEMEVIVEDDKVKKTTGSRRLGRLTPTSHPPLVWTVTPVNGKCPDGVNYPYVPKLDNSQVSAAIQDKSSIILSAQSGRAGVAMKWIIDPKQAKQVSPDIQYGKPERFNGLLCQDKFLFETVWVFPRFRNTIKTTQDTFDHLQILTVTQVTTAMGLTPGVSTGHPPLTKYFNGDILP